MKDGWKSYLFLNGTERQTSLYQQDRANLCAIARTDIMRYSVLPQACYEVPLLQTIDTQRLKIGFYFQFKKYFY
jgi:hypothetical protein